MREVYAERLATLLECARDRMAGLLKISGVEAGLQTAAWLHNALDAESVAAAAADAKEIRRGIGDLSRTLEKEFKRLRTATP
jgi:DNA-binding transcriptional MocR family regulator